MIEFQKTSKFSLNTIIFTRPLTFHSSKAQLIIEYKKPKIKKSSSIQDYIQAIEAYHSQLKS